eukprot:TRINITY_DN12270_c0_g1_i11.p1 TRINITY_DN12270_c0_g1~~TRINITY_DN12270_c0_g1_i11.p1  ORF type:complete len:222 (+),score=14.01 TRINITY_DN12270_c0_g1_i11:69-734(+)
MCIRDRDKDFELILQETVFPEEVDLRALKRSYNFMDNSIRSYRSTNKSKPMDFTPAEIISTFVFITVDSRSHCEVFIGDQEGQSAEGFIVRERAIYKLAQIVRGSLCYAFNSLKLIQPPSIFKLTVHPLVPFPQRNHLKSRSFIPYESNHTRPFKLYSMDKVFLPSYEINTQSNSSPHNNESRTVATEIGRKNRTEEAVLRHTEYVMRVVTIGRIAQESAE